MNETTAPNVLDKLVPFYVDPGSAIFTASGRVSSNAPTAGTGGLPDIVRPLLAVLNPRTYPVNVVGLRLRCVQPGDGGRATLALAIGSKLIVTGGEALRIASKAGLGSPAALEVRAGALSMQKRRTADALRTLATVPLHQRQTLAGDEYILDLVSTGGGEPHMTGDTHAAGPSALVRHSGPLRLAGYDALVACVSRPGQTIPGIFDVEIDLATLPR